MNKERRRKSGIPLVGDIPRGKRSEEAYRNSAARFEELFNKAAIPLCFVDKHGETLNFNTRFEKTFGYSQEEVPTLNAWWKLAYPDPIYRKWVIDTCDAALQRAVKAETDIEPIEYHVTCKNGDIRTMVVFGSFIGHDLLLTFFDITEHKKSEEALKASEARYMDLYENAPDMYASVNARTASIEKCNQTLADILGRPKKEIIGRPVFEIYHPDCLDRAKEVFQEFLDRGEIRDKELQLRRKDGSKLDVSLNVSAVRGEDGQILFSRSTLRDITERKRNNAINKARLHLMQFAVSHSLNELLEETLNEAEKLTDSLIGFYHFVEDDQKSLTLQNWSARTKAEFCKAKGKGLHYPVAEAGVWVDCVYQGKPVIHNDYASLPHRKGMPDGHAEVIRELVVPVIRDNKIKAILGVGNKPTDYNEKDVEAISLLADLAWEIAERKQAEQQVALMSFALNGVHEAAFMIDENARLQYVNNEACRLVGYSRDKLLTMTVPDINPGFTMGRWSGHWSKLMEHGAFTFEGKLKARDGRLIPVEINANYFEFEGQSYDFGLVRDITERKRAEEALLRSDQRLRLHSEQSPLGFLEWDDNFRAIEWNAACERIFGYTREEALGRHAKDLILPIEVHELVDGIYHSLMSQSGGQHSINENVTKDGRTIICEWFNTTLINKEGIAIGVASVCRDITEQKRMEVELARYREHLEEQVKERTAELEIAKNKAQQYLDIAGVILVAIDADRRITLINQKGCEILGCTAGEIIGKDWFETFVPANIRQAVIQVFDRLVAGEIEVDEFFENPVLAKSGQERLIAWHNAILRDDGGHIVGTLSSGEDITEEKRAQEEITNLNQDLLNRTAQLEEANKAKSMFLANMSHELRTPLNTILGFSNLIGRDPSLTVAQRGNLEIIGRSGEHLLDLINDILEMSKIEAGQIELRITGFDLNDTLSEIEQVIRSRAEAKGLEFHMDRGPDVPRYIKTDEQKLRQVLLNLADNAVKFTREGHITLRVKTESMAHGSKREGEDRSATQTPCPTPYAPCLIFEVEDTGPGLTAEEMKTIFEPFVQKRDDQAYSEGTGLGLAICRRYVQLMGGDIAVKSEVGDGSVFAFDIKVEILDRREIQPETRTGRVLGLEPNHPAYRILVVEDNLENRILLVKLLRSVGFDVREAVNGQEAVEQFKIWQPHLVWMDMRMPVMDGYTATREIRNSKSNIGNVPIIAITAHAFEEEKGKILAAGCDDCIRKPFEEAQVFGLMKKHLGVRYIYDEGQGRHVKGESEFAEGELTSEALAGLGQDLLAALKQAALDLDIERIQIVIDQIRDHNAEMADVLADLVKKYQYEKILSLIPEE